MSNPKLVTLNPFRALFGFVGIIIISWIFLHLLAFLGVFLALAYPMWWLFFPQLTTCIPCQALTPGSTCPFCHRAIDKNNLRPTLLSAVFKNALLIFFVSIVSIGVVYLESRLLMQLGYPSTPKTAEFVIPPKGQYRLEEIFPLKLEIIGLTTPINAVQTDLSFDPRKLQVVDISTQDSFANIFIQKEIDNERGYARLTGGLPNPGYFSDRGLFGTVYFKGIQPGIVTVDYLDTSLVLANDSHGTNILKDPPSVSYLITPEKVSQADNQLQTALFSDQVLGAKTQSDQLIFYSDSPVLGAKTSQAPTSPPSFLTRCLEFLSRLNDLILRFWARLFHILPD